MRPNQKLIQLVEPILDQHVHNWCIDGPSLVLLFWNVFFFHRMDNRKRGHYSNEALKSAIKELKNGVLWRAAARKYGIPRVTLMRKFQNHSETKGRPGPPTKFNVDQETMLVKWIKYMAKTGFPVSKETLMFSVDKLARDANFHKSTIPGRKWYEGFLKRHPDISKNQSKFNCAALMCYTATNRCMVWRGWKLYKGQKNRRRIQKPKQNF